MCKDKLAKLAKEQQHDKCQTEPVKVTVSRGGKLPKQNCELEYICMCVCVCAGTQGPNPQATKLLLGNP